MMRSLTTIDPATFADRDALVRLLRLVDLPAERVDEHLPNFLVARNGERIIGCVGMEVYGDVCLLRSLAVDPEYQGKGIGRRLLQAIIDQARALELQEAVVLTRTAEDLAAAFGFERIARETVDPRLAGSWEFQANACRTATCLTLKL